MPTLELRFQISLIAAENRVMPGSGPHGPLFHRWLPDGLEDAIALRTGHSNAELIVYFERLGYVDQQQVQFDPVRHEVEPAVMERQAILEAGPLLGLLRVLDVANNDVEALEQGPGANPQYESFARKVIQRFLTPPLQRFVAILRSDFGQYWLPPFEVWDSRNDTLGSYCRWLGMKWRVVGGPDQWNPFEPDEAIHMIRLVGRHPRVYAEHMTQNDWLLLRSIAQSDYESSLAVQLLMSAHALAERGEWRYAIVEGQTGLEVALDEFVRTRLTATGSGIADASAFADIPLRQKLIVVAALTGKVLPDELRLALGAIELRNKIVHEGYQLSRPEEEGLQGLLRTGAALLPAGKLKFPTGFGSNHFASSAEWERAYELWKEAPLKESG